MGYSSILGVVIFEKTMGAILAGVAVSFAVSFICTYFLYDGKSIK
jgi:PTS system beta-glucosides-specific IIC component